MTPQRLTREQLIQMGATPIAPPSSPIGGSSVPTVTPKVAPSGVIPGVDAWNAMGKILPNFTSGIKKGALETVKNAASAGQKVLRKFASPFVGDNSFGQSGPTAAEKLIPASATDAKNPGERMGKSAEGMGEFLVPVGGEEKAVGFIPKLLKATEGALEFGSKTAVKGGTKGEVLTSSIAGAAGGHINEFIGKVAEKVLPGIARAIEKANLKLTRNEEIKLGANLKKVTDWLVKNNIVGSAAERTAKVEAAYNDAEKVYQEFLDKRTTIQKPAPGPKPGENNLNWSSYNPKTGKIEATQTFAGKGKSQPLFTVAKQKIIDGLEAVKKTLMRDNPDAKVIAKQVDAAIENIKNQYRTGTVAISRLNVLKRNTMENAFNKAGTKVLDAVEFAIGDVYKTLVEDSAKGIPGGKIGDKTIEEFNQEYGTIIDARKAIQMAEGRPMSRVYKGLLYLLGGALGFQHGGALGALGGGVGLEKAAELFHGVGTGVTSRIGHAAETATPAAVKYATGAVGRVAVPLLTPDPAKQKRLDMMRKRLKANQ